MRTRLEIIARIPVFRTGEWMRRAETIKNRVARREELARALSDLRKYNIDSEAI